MFDSSTQSILIFIITSILLILLLAVFIGFIIYKYQQKQNTYNKEITELKMLHENDLLNSQIEIQEQTFQNISREIHDNIGQKLTLAKLNLNTIDLSKYYSEAEKIKNSIDMIGESINDLSDISRSMSSELVLNNGLIKALEFEVNQLRKTGIYNVSLDITGDSIFLESGKELIIFRIVQETISNIIKHAQASIISINFHYHATSLELSVSDNGIGFEQESKKLSGSGITNMRKRAALLQGSFSVESKKASGTSVKIIIPTHEPNTIV